jgi:glycine cleavage system H protein
MQEYDDGRIWFKRKGGVVTVGLTEKALDEIGGVQAVALPAEGDDLYQDDVVCEIEGERQNFELISPVDGGVLEVNDALSEEPSLLREDPLDEGWILKIRVQARTSDSEDSEEDSE